MKHGALQRLVRQSPVYPLLRPRKFRAYCLGGRKTGTVSMARLFGAYRSEHEPIDTRTVDLVLGAHRGTLTSLQIRETVRRRDRDFFLEMESSHPVSILVEHLVDEFPDARFILTTREPRGWLDSNINQQLNYPLEGRWGHYYRELREVYHRIPDPVYRPGEQVLRERGLYTLEGYLRYWSEHNRRVLDAVPADRLFVLRTNDIIARADELAAFVGVDPSTLRKDRGHSHTAPVKHDIVSRIDPVLLSDAIAEYCSDVMQRIDRLVSGPAPDAQAASSPT